MSCMGVDSHTFGGVWNKPSYYYIYNKTPHNFISRGKPEILAQ